jgi:hypothetical protein
MMTEISADLVKGLFKERGIEFEESDMDFIKGFFNTAPSTVISVSVEKVTPEPEVKKKKKPAKGKAAAPEPEPEPESDSCEEKPAKGKAAKGKGKPKCQATTAKGTPCSKCACEGEIFCSVHLSSTTKSKKETDGESSAKKKKPTVAKKVTPKHTHGMTSPVPDTGCDLCETHGMPFEIPEYEEEEDGNDPTYIPALEEEDFDEIDE